MSPLSCSSLLLSGTEYTLVRDANGLPMIPGSTLQGLLRALYTSPDRSSLFGGKLEDGSARPARLIFSNAHVHDSANQVVGFPQSSEALRQDPVLVQLSSESPLRRDHVRLDHRLAPARLFTRSAIPPGTRFSFEILFAGAEEEAAAFVGVVELLHHPLFRIGSASRRGYGRVHVREARRGFVTDPQIFRNILQSPLCDQSQLSVTIGASHFPNVTAISLRLRALNPWRTGANGFAVRTGSLDHPRADRRLKPVEAAPTREPRIIWDDRNQATWSNPGIDKTGYILPGSAIRGPLAHRTLFHWNRIRGLLIGAGTVETRSDVGEWASRRGDLNLLFGALGDRKTAVRPGALIVEDVAITPRDVAVVSHNGIDRFTGGARPGVVFSEELIVSGDFTVEILVDEREGVDADARAALCQAIRDLCEGRLALGAKNYGFCAGSADWGSSPPEHWLSAWSQT